VKKGGYFAPFRAVPPPEQKRPAFIFKELFQPPQRHGQPDSKQNILA
jgi:hypothetical protein